MPEDRFEIDADIGRASTLPSRWYAGADEYAMVRGRVLARSWQLVADSEQVRQVGSAVPLTLLEGSLDEPIVLSRGDDDVLRCLSNVCTHRGGKVVEHAGAKTCLTCPYHGRRFELDGSLRAMPEFDGVEGFPSASDDLPALPMGQWRGFVFAGIEPEGSIEDLVGEMEGRVGFLPIEQARRDAGRSRDYLVRANWALYCDNYLEGFHIPFVHGSLHEALDYGSYRTELLRRGVLQIGFARGAEDTFELPVGHPDSGERVAAYWYWLYPNTMLNFYPWGLSVNIVRPLGVSLTKVSYWTYVWDEARLGDGFDLDRVEREDQGVVESVQIGVRSRLYDRGRYSPTRETGVHHFHRMIADALAGPDA